MTLLTEDSKRSLLRRARAAIALAIGAPAPVAPSASASAAAAATVDKPNAPDAPSFRAGAFVTLHLNGELRGCIGYPEDDLPLIDVVDRCAVSAAISDPRFPALALDEWSEVDIEISVLGPIERVSDISEVVVGRHGLIVELGTVPAKTFGRRDLVKAVRSLPRETRVMLVLPYYELNSNPVVVTPQSRNGCCTPLWSRR